MKYRQFFSYLKEGVEKYLIWEPTGDLRTIANRINTLHSNPDELYRGGSDAELSILQKSKVFQSRGLGNTRDNAGTYVSSDIHLAGAFAMRYLRDHKGGNIFVLDKSKLPNPIQRDPGNYSVDHIPLEAVKKIIRLGEITH